MRRSSATKPMLLAFLPTRERTVLKMITSFSRPWKPSIVFTSTLRAMSFSSSSILARSSRTWLWYGLITPMRASAPSVRSCARVDTVTSRRGAVGLTRSLIAGAAACRRLDGRLLGPSAAQSEPSAWRAPRR